jgi:hypothetical protein
MQCVNASGCVVTTSGAGATTTYPTGFTAQLPAGTLPPGFIGVVNTPGGGNSRNVRRPNLVAGANPYLNNDRNLINPAAFTTPLPGTFGNLPRNALRGPNFSQLDLIFNKRFRFTETMNLEFRTEIFNILNHTNFANPGTTLSLALPTATFTAANPGAGTVAFFTLPTGLQPGGPYTQSAAGGTFGLVRQTVVRDVGLGTSRQIQFALRLNF